jgi:hypothetical protein
VRILGLDPGPKITGYVVYHSTIKAISRAGNLPNEELADWMGAQCFDRTDYCVIEFPRAVFGTPGPEMFIGMLWAGRFAEIWGDDNTLILMDRSEMKYDLLGSRNGKDPQVKAALEFNIGPKGTAKQPGPTFKVTEHAWAALAVAYVFGEQHEKGGKKKWVSFALTR